MGDDQEDSVFVRGVNGEENGEINGVVSSDPPRGGIECIYAPGIRSLLLPWFVKNSGKFS